MAGNQECKIAKHLFGNVYKLRHVTINPTQIKPRSKETKKRGPPENYTFGVIPFEKKVYE